MSETFTRLEVEDVRFPTSRTLSGSDAMNKSPDYSAAYLTLFTSGGDCGYGFTFTIGRGNDVQAAAIRALAGHVIGRSVDEVLSDLGGFWKQLVSDSQLRWLGPEKGVMHMAIGALVNAVWDLAARRAGKPLWRFLAEMRPEEILAVLDFRHLTDAITPEEALELLKAAQAGKETRIQQLLDSGYPAYTTSAGWLGYDDDKVVSLCREAVTDGFTHLKLKVGADIDDDLRRCRLVRDTVGPDVLLSIDANQAWEVAEAVENVQRLSEAGLYWIEEPVSPDDILGHGYVASKVRPIRVATGEHVANRIVFKQLLASRAIDVCQIDACRVAGVNENIAIMLMAAKYGVPVCPHAGGVGLCEVVQHLSMFDFAAVSGSSEGRWIEFVDHLHEHFEVPVRVGGGRYLAPTEPGSGAEMRAESVTQFAFPDGPAWAGASTSGKASHEVVA